jgi:ribose-phosphate pyrophosphokinase
VQVTWKFIKGEIMPVTVINNGTHIDYEQWKFPGGEIGVKLPEIKTRKGFTVSVYGVPTSDDFFVACNLLDALHRLGIPKEEVALYYSYLPYARQDRKCHEGESFALYVFVNLLMSMQYAFNCLWILDPHSQVSVQLLDNFAKRGFSVMVTSQHSYTMYLPEFDVIIAPDAGAAGKASFTQPDKKHIFLDKVRVDGKVLYQNYAHDTIVGSACIVDDICDGGATFLSAAEMLRATQPRMTSLSLYVTHGIFSKGIDILKEKFDNVYTANPMTSAAHQATTVPF